MTEVIHSMLEEGPTVCERCGGELRRVLHPAGIIFKGSGFYRTDSRNGGSPSTASKSGGETKSESKPDSGSSATKDAGSTTKADTAESA